MQTFKIWTKRTDINNLSITKKYLASGKYKRHDVALEDILEWKAFRGSKNFAAPPKDVSFKVEKLSYNKFLQIFSELVLHFNGRNLSTYHQALTIDRHPVANSILDTTPGRPLAPPDILSPLAMSPVSDQPGTPQVQASGEREETQPTLSGIINVPHLHYNCSRF